ncbi:hypothetical protein MA16_Dca016653 [Dendrobium catenatum]|uniref:Uncharacterized protein n=1 Tax=Dendrobium catenatum TaxID=906689 RepID=A0A2I0WB71_9ASPA|nr:hypothetical protein MA16_Dca016653 [Dendrobium catenatum]
MFVFSSIETGDSSFPCVTESLRPRFHILYQTPQNSQPCEPYPHIVLFNRRRQLPLVFRLCLRSRSLTFHFEPQGDAAASP